jgi:hypothetical protein
VKYGIQLAQIPARCDGRFFWIHPIIFIHIIIKVKIFSEVPGFVDEDGVSHKTKIIDNTDVMKKNDKIYFCGEIENFRSIQIFATGKNISFIVNFGNKTIFKKNDIEIKDKIKFTNKDFDLMNLGNYVILVKQGDNILFKKEIEVTTCD